MKKQSRKLNLNRETILPLQSDDMAAINGGDTPSTITTSSAACTASIASLLSAISHSLKTRGPGC